MQSAHESFIAASGIRILVVVVLLLAGLGCESQSKQRGTARSSSATSHNSIEAITPNVAWRSYSEDEVKAAVSSGKCAIVFVYPQLSVSSKHAISQLDHDKLVEICGSDDYVTFMLRYSDWSDPRIKEAWDDVGHTKKPFIALYLSTGLPMKIDPLAGID